MALKAIIDTLESVDEGHRALYRKVDAQGDPLAGKFVLEVEAVDGWALFSSAAFVTALESERGRREKAEEALKGFEGVDPTEAKSLKADLARLATLDPNHHAELLAAEKFEAAKAELQRETAAQAEEAERRHRRLLDRFRELLITGPMTAAASRLGGNVALLRPIIEARTRVRETSQGEVVVEVLDDRGIARIKDASGALMTTEDLIVEMSRSTDFAPLFSPTGGGVRLPTGPNPWRRETWNITAQHRMLRQNPAEAERLKAEASGGPTERNPWRQGQWNVTEQMKLIRSDPTAADRLQRAAGISA